jgi:hypothetical protein
VVDLAVGRWIEIATPDAGSPITWTADSNLALVLAGQRVRLYDRTAQRMTVVEGLPELMAVADARA